MSCYFFVFLDYATSSFLSCVLLPDNGTWASRQQMRPTFLLAKMGGRFCLGKPPVLHHYSLRLLGSLLSHCLRAFPRPGDQNNPGQLQGKRGEIEYDGQVVSSCATVDDKPSVYFLYSLT